MSNRLPSSEREETLWELLLEGDAKVVQGLLLFANPRSKPLAGSEIIVPFPHCARTKMTRVMFSTVNTQSTPLH
jgi:hypothetical protein